MLCNRDCGREAVAAGVCCPRCPDHGKLCEQTQRVGLEHAFQHVRQATAARHKPLVLKTTGETIGEAEVEGPLITWTPDEAHAYIHDIHLPPPLAVDAGDVVLLLTELEDINLAVMAVRGGPQ